MKNKGNLNALWSSGTEQDTSRKTGEIWIKPMVQLTVNVQCQSLNFGKYTIVM